MTVKRAAFQQAKVQSCEGYFGNRWKSTVQKPHLSFRPPVISSRWPPGAPESWCPWRCPPESSVDPSETLRLQGRAGGLRGGWGPWAGTEGAPDWCWSCGSNLVWNRWGSPPGESGGRSQDPGGSGGRRRGRGTGSEEQALSWRRNVGRFQSCRRRRAHRTWRRELGSKVSFLHERLRVERPEGRSGQRRTRRGGPRRPGGSRKAGGAPGQQYRGGPPALRRRSPSWAQSWLPPETPGPTAETDDQVKTERRLAILHRNQLRVRKQPGQLELLCLNRAAMNANKRRTPQDTQRSPTQGVTWATAKTNDSSLSLWSGNHRESPSAAVPRARREQVNVWG